MAVFEPLNIAPNFIGWGPPPGAEEAVGPEFNMNHLDKFSPTAHQQWGRICDFTVSGMKFQEQRLAKGKGKGKFGKQILMPKKPTDEEGFDIVDSRKLPVKGGKGGGKGSKGGKAGKVAVNYQEGILGQKMKPTVFQMNNGKGKGKGKKGFGNRGRGMPSFKEWSVQTKSEWEMKREIMLSALAKAQVDSRQVEEEDLTWCGNLRQYDKAFDRIVVRTEKPMSRYESLAFFNVTTSEDPYLPEFMSNDPSVTVIATDQVLASLIAAARSVYSWDVVVTKIQGRLIFDKRDGSSLDFLTVNETAQEPPNNDEPNDKNAPQKLGQEASCINQNFSQMVLGGDAEVMENSNPFMDEDEPEATASGAYRYRKITLPGNPKDENPFGQQNVTMVVRTEVNCKLGDSYVSTKILNEYEPKATYSWRLHLETQRGAVLATELKNNAFKIARWAAQAMLSGCDIMKLGYASRVNPKDPWSHTLLGVQTHYTDNFADQIGMSRNNAFGILRSIIDIVMDWEDGKYLILKDPTKAVMRFYEVPADCFDEEEEEEEEFEEEGPDLDEDGNIKPERPLGPMGIGMVGRM